MDWKLFSRWFLILDLWMYLSCERLWGRIFKMRCIRYSCLDGSHEWFFRKELWEGMGKRVRISIPEKGRNIAGQSVSSSQGAHKSWLSSSSVHQPEIITTDKGGRGQTIDLLSVPDFPKRINGNTKFSWFWCMWANMHGNAPSMFMIRVLLNSLIALAIPTAKSNTSFWIVLSTPVASLSCR